jgi:hypothetical protein
MFFNTKKHYEIMWKHLKNYFNINLTNLVLTHELVETNQNVANGSFLFIPSKKSHFLFKCVERGVFMGLFILLIESIWFSKKSYHSDIIGWIIHILNIQKGYVDSVSQED